MSSAPVIIMDEFKIDFSSKGLEIDFKKFLPSEGLTDEENNLLKFICITKKRTHSKAIERIAKIIEEFIRFDNTLLYDIYELRCHLKHLTDLFDGKDVAFIRNYFTERLLVINMKIAEVAISTIDDAYTQSIEANNNRIDEQFQYNDIHAKILLVVALLVNFSSPHLADFIKEYEMEDDQVMVDFIILLIDEICKRYSTEETGNINLVLKLRKLVKSKVQSTEYSDKVIWSYIPNAGIDPVSQVQVLYKKLISDVIFKLDVSQNVINFLHVVLKNQIKYIFKAKLPISYKPIISIQDDESNIFDNNFLMVTHSEIDAVIQPYYIEEIKNRMFNEHEIFIKDKLEFEYYTSRLKPNREQQKILFLFYMSFIEDNIQKVSRRQYFILLILFIKYLKKFNFNNLAKFMCANLEENKDVRHSSLNKKAMMAVVESKDYKDLYSEKYKFLADKFNDSMIVVKLVESLVKNQYRSVPSYEDRDIVQPEILEFREELVADEILKFIKSFN